MQRCRRGDAGTGEGGLRVGDGARARDGGGEGNQEEADKAVLHVIQ
jgi:hypothetical protein